MVQRDTRGPAHCASVEWRYVTMRELLREGEEESRRTPRPVLDYKDADVVNRAWVALPNTGTAKNCLKLHYVLRMDEWRLCRVLGIRNDRLRRNLRAAFDDAHASILLMLLRSGQQMHYDREQQPAASARSV